VHTPALKQKLSGNQSMSDSKLSGDVWHAYRVFAQNRAAQLLHKSVYGLIAIYLIVVVPISLFSTDSALSFWQACVVAPIGTVLTLMLIFTRLPQLEQWVEPMLAMSLTICLIGTLFCNMNLAYGPFAQITSYQAIYILIIGFSILRIPTRLALYSTLTAVVIAAVASVINGATLNALDLILAYFVPLVLCAISGLMLERGDHDSFYKQHQLNIEAQRIESMHEKAERALHEQQRHARFLELLAGNLDHKTLFTRILNFVVDETKSLVGVGCIVTPDAQLHPVAGWGISLNEQQKMGSSTLDGGLATQAMTDGRILHVEEIPPNYLPIKTGTEQFQPKAVLIIPVQQAGVTIAILEIGRLTPYSNTELQFIQSLCQPSALAIVAANNRNADYSEQLILQPA
jgi:GAF domain-containing protein